MAPNARAAKAFAAMKAIGIHKKTVKPVLLNLLRLYDKNWELIEEEDYRALADAIFDYEEPEEREERQKGEAIASESEPPLKRLCRQQGGQSSTSVCHSSPTFGGGSPKRPTIEDDRSETCFRQERTETVQFGERVESEPVSPITHLKNMGKESASAHTCSGQEGADPLEISRGEERNETLSALPQTSEGLKGKEPVLLETAAVDGGSNSVFRDKGKEPVGPQIVLTYKRLPSKRAADTGALKEPKIEQGIVLLPREKAPNQMNNAFTGPKIEEFTNDLPQFEVPIAMIHPNPGPPRNQETEEFTNDLPQFEVPIAMIHPHPGPPRNQETEEFTNDLPQFEVPIAMIHPHPGPPRNQEVHMAARGGHQAPMRGRRRGIGRGRGEGPQMPFLFRSEEAEQLYFTHFRNAPINHGRPVTVEEVAAFRITERFDALGWGCMLHLPEPTYPDMVRYFYSNLTYHEELVGENDSRLIIESRVKNKDIRFSTQTLAHILDVPYVPGERRWIWPESLFDDVLHHIERRLIFSVLCDTECTSVKRGRYMLPSARVISRIVSRNIVPKGGHQDHISQMQAFVTFAIYVGFPIDLAYVIQNAMISRVKNPGVTNLAFGRLLTRIFTYFGVDLEGEHELSLGIGDPIGRRLISKMGLQGGAESPVLSGDMEGGDHLSPILSGDEEDGDQPHRQFEVHSSFGARAVPEDDTQSRFAPVPPAPSRSDDSLWDVLLARLDRIEHRQIEMSEQFAQWTSMLHQHMQPPPPPPPQD